MTEETDAAATSSSASSIDVDLTEVLPTITRQRIQWPGGPSMRQVFSLPESIIYYIAKNPSSAKGYLKLVQCCKYFFEVNPIIVAASIHGKSKIGSRTFGKCKNKNGICCIDLDIEKCLSKIWLTDELILNENTDTNYTSMLCPKIYQSEIRSLQLYGKTVFLDDFEFLASSVTDLVILNIKIIRNDGNIVSIDEILECVPKLEYFSFWFKNDESSSTLKNIAKLNDLVHLKLLCWMDFPEMYSVEDISKFMKAHKDMMIFLEFNDTVSEDYKDQLDALIDTLIESEAADQIIKYDGQDAEKYKIMKNHLGMIFSIIFFNSL